LDFVKNRPRTMKIGVVAFGEGGLVVQPPNRRRRSLGGHYQPSDPSERHFLGGRHHGRSDRYFRLGRRRSNRRRYD
jgi:hypothetical protein